MSRLSDFFRDLFRRKPAASAAPQTPVFVPVPPTPVYPPTQPPRPDPAALEPVRPTLADSPPGITRFGVWPESATAAPDQSAANPLVVAVTSPRGNVRFYPRPIPSTAPMQGDFNLFTYATRISQMTNPATGKPYYPPSATGVVVQFPVNGRPFPECVDEMLYPDDWDDGRGQRIRDEQAKMFATAMATGPFNPRDLTDTDLNWLMHCGAEMTFDPRQLGRGPFYGPDVGRMGSQKYVDYISDFPGTEAKVTPALVAAVREMAQLRVLPWMAEAFPEMADPTWRDQHLISWNAGWKRLHPGQEP